MKRLSKIKRSLTVLLGIALVIMPGFAQAQQRNISFIRDAEIERNIRAYATPIWEAAGLRPEAIQIFLINDKNINAFVAAGQNIFVHTGLIQQADKPSQIIGVLAHETGHITGGHLARSDEAFSKSTAITILSLLAGAAAMASGAGDAGAALMTSSPLFAQRAFLSFSRTQEASADQAALRYLEATGQSAEGLVEFFETLAGQEALLTKNQDPYVRSHPLTRDRIDTILNQGQKSEYWDAPENAEFVEMLRRMKAKLDGFLLHPARVFQRYPESDKSLYGYYARAVGYHRQAKLDEALAEIEVLLAMEPDNPFFNELHGQILFESGKIERSIDPYRKAVEQAPTENLLRVSLAQSLIATGEDAYNEEAIRNLKVANLSDPYNSFAWHQLAIAYHRADQTAMADLATAERYLLIGRFPEALQHARRANNELQEGTPEWWRAQDIVYMAEEMAERAARRR